MAVNVPRTPIGTTGTDSRAATAATSAWNDCTTPSRVRLPSGKTSTFQPEASTFASGPTSNRALPSALGSDCGSWNVLNASAAAPAFHQLWKNASEVSATAVRSRQDGGQRRQHRADVEVRGVVGHQQRSGPDRRTGARCRGSPGSPRPCSTGRSTPVWARSRTATRNGVRAQAVGIGGASSVPLDRADRGARGGLDHLDGQVPVPAGGQDPQIPDRLGQPTGAVAACRRRRPRAPAPYSSSAPVTRRPPRPGAACAGS